MIEEADFQKVGNAAIDLCVFVEKLRLGKKHREEANKLTHNVLNLIKQTGKIKEEPLTKGRKNEQETKNTILESPEGFGNANPRTRGVAKL